MVEVVVDQPVMIEVAEQQAVIATAVVGAADETKTTTRTRGGQSAVIDRPIIIPIDVIAERIGHRSDMGDRMVLCADGPVKIIAIERIQLSTGALFVMAGMLKERLHTRDLGLMGGLWTGLPYTGGVFMLFTMASLGLPMLGNFIAEFLILLGAFSVSPVLTVLASGGLVLSALYSLRMAQKVFLGPMRGGTGVKDLSGREWLLLAAMSISIVALGLFPQPVIDLVRPVVRLLVSN